MSSSEQNPSIESGPVLVGPTFSPKELCVLLIKHNGLHEGVFNLQIEFQVGTGAVGPDPDNLSPGMMFGISKVGLVAATSPTSMSIDAARVNPLPASTKPAAKRTKKADAQQG